MHERVERDVPAKIRQAVLERDNHQCQACGTTNGLHLHHWSSFRSLGGVHESENLITVCFKCHGLIHSRAIDIALIEWVPGEWAAFVTGRFRRRGG